MTDPKILAANQNLLKITPAASGRTLKEDGTVVNMADLAVLIAAGFSAEGLVSALAYGTDVDGNGVAIGATDDALHTVEQGVIGGGKLEDSEDNNFTSTRDETNPIVLTGTGAITIGGGAAFDSHLMKAVIAANGTAVTLIVTGIANESDVAKSFTFTGSTTADTHIDLGAMLNPKAALTVQASVADKVLILTRSAV